MRPDWDEEMLRLAFEACRVARWTWDKTFREFLQLLLDEHGSPYELKRLPVQVKPRTGLPGEEARRILDGWAAAHEPPPGNAA